MHHPSPSIRAAHLAAAAALAIGATQPAQALLSTYDGYVQPAPGGCAPIGSIYDGAPKSRPTAIIKGVSVAAFKAAVVQGPVRTGMRDVALSYNVSAIEDRVPANFAGIFYASSSRVQIYPSTAVFLAPLSDRTYVTSATTSASTFAWSGTVRETLPNPSSVFQNTWTAVVSVQGYQQTNIYTAWKPATLNFQCNISVDTGSTPVFTL